MRYHIKERAWSFPEDFVVLDDDGSAVFEIRGAFVDIDDDLVLIDRSTRQELARAHMKQHLPTLALQYEIQCHGRLWANMHDRFRFFHEDFKIETGDGSVMRVKGDTLRWNFNLIDQTDHTLAHISHQGSMFPGCYAIEIAENVDEVAMVTLIIVMDIVRERQDQSSS